MINLLLLNDKDHLESPRHPPRYNFCTGSKMTQYKPCSRLKMHIPRKLKTIPNNFVIKTITNRSCKRFYKDLEFIQFPMETPLGSFFDGDIRSIHSISMVTSHSQTILFNYFFSIFYFSPYKSEPSLHLRPVCIPYTEIFSIYFTLLSMQ